MGDKKRSGGQDGADGWVPIATFIIEYQQSALKHGRASGPLAFRTVAHYLEGSDKVLWAGLAGDSLGSWLLTHSVEAAGKKFTKLPEDPNLHVQMPSPGIFLHRVEVYGQSGASAISDGREVFTGYVSGCHAGVIRLYLKIDAPQDLPGPEYLVFSASICRLSDGRRFFTGMSPVCTEASGMLGIDIESVDFRPGIYTLRLVAVVGLYNPSLYFSDIGLLVVVSS